MKNLSKYRAHIEACNAICQASPEGTKRMVTFVLATIQQQLESVPTILKSFDTEKRYSKFAFGTKKAGLDYIEIHASEVHSNALAARDNPLKLLRVFLKVPGLGLVKAGFACQLFANKVGCLDTHNIKIYDVPLSALRYDKQAKREDTKLRALQRYLALCETCGGSTVLWAAWCDYKASLVPHNWDNGGLGVSQFHVEALLRKYDNTVPEFFDNWTGNPAFQSEGPEGA